MSIERLNDLIQVLDSDELQIRTAKDLIRFKQEYGAKTNMDLLAAIIIHRFSVQYF